MDLIRASVPDIGVWKFAKDLVGSYRCNSIRYAVEKSQRTTESAVFLVLLPGMDGTGELLPEFVAALPATVESVIVRYPTERSLGYSELVDFVRAACPSSAPFVQ
jgi:hypothetical protein